MVCITCREAVSRVLLTLVDSGYFGTTSDIFDLQFNRLLI